MKIKSITFKEFNLKLSEPFSYYTATLECLPYEIITIKTDNEIFGFGEAALAWDVTGETQEGALGLFKYIKPLLINHKLNSIEDIKEMMKNIDLNVHENSALKSGIEFALLDVLGKFKNKPVYKLLGGKEKEFVVAQRVFPYKEKHSDDLQQKITLSLQNGAEIIKFKAGENSEIDYQIIEKVVNFFPTIKLVLDVNQGWKNFLNAWPIIKKLEKFKKNILWIEQPIFSSDYEGLAELSKKSEILIMADESCHNLLDLKNLYLNKSVKLINIKLAKCGGILPAMEMVKFCEEKDIKYMLGDMINSPLGTAANLQMATLGNFISYDLTLNNKIESDPTSGLKIDGYKFYIPQTSGIGVSLKN